MVGRPTKSVSYRLAELVLRAVMTVVTRRDWHGAEHLPLEGGYVVVVNHISHADPLTLAHFLVRNGSVPRFLAKEEVFRVPVVGPVLLHAGQIPVYRESTTAAKAYSTGVGAVRDGEAIVIYPEGTLTRDPDLWPMRGKTGAARIARETGCPVIPVVQWGPQRLLPAYGRVPNPFRRARIHLQVGPRVPIRWPAERGTGAAEAQLLSAATETVMATLTTMLETVRDETAPLTRWDPRRHGQPVTGDPGARRRA